MTDHWIKGRSPVGRRPTSGAETLSSRFTNAATAPFSGLATLRWAEPDDVDTWNGIGFEALDGFGGGYGIDSSGILLFPSGSNGEYLITLFAEVEKASGVLRAQLDDISAGIGEIDSAPAADSIGRLNLASVHRFFYYDDNPPGGNVGFSIGLYESSGLDNTLVAATLTITKLKSIPTL